MVKTLREMLANLPPERRARISAEADRLRRALQVRAKPCKGDESQGQETHRFEIDGKG